LFPIFIIFFIGSIAETNRAPFDLAEAESELVSGFMTEHAAVIFVFFFLAEYASILLMCIFNSILFLGGYLFNYLYFVNLFIFIINTLFNIYDSLFAYDMLFTDTIFNDLDKISLSFLHESVFFGIIIAIKTCFFVFSFIWVRASLPRIRFDQLMSYC